jgi:hypothetical protein
MRSIGCALAIIAVVAGGRASAQDAPGRSCHQPTETIYGRPARDWATRFAPILRFADAEAYYPSVPFFAAMDGEDNVGTESPIDMSDPEEIAPGLASTGGVVWEELDTMYRGSTREEPITAGMTAQVLPPTEAAAANPAVKAQVSERQRRLNATSVGYRVCTLDDGETDAVWRFLRSDEQAWRRFRSFDLAEAGLRESSKFLVVEYYLYYVNDAGLAGHPNDTEGVTVFQLLDQRQSGDAQWRGEPIIIVGQGHSSLTPNNVSVIMPGDQLGLAWVQGFRKPTIEGSTGRGTLEDGFPNILVEFGGHSSSPDLRPYGAFTAGVDINWHLDDVWGVRDIQAVGGTGFGGEYRFGMQFPRSPSAPVAVPVEDGCKVYREDRSCGSYALVHIGDLQRLVEAAAASEISNQEFRAFVDSTFKGRFKNFNGFGADASDATVTAARRAFGRWMEKVSLHGKPVDPWRYQPWRWKSAKSLSTDQFKQNLFRPAATGIGSFLDFVRLLTYGVRWETGNQLEPYFGVVIPAFASDRVPIRFPGFLEAQFGLYDDLGDGDRPPVLAMSMVWNQKYVGNVPVSSYQRVSWIPNRGTALGDTTVANGSLAGGVSLLLPVKKHKKPFDPVNAIRLAVGFRIDLGHWDDALRDAGLEFAVSMRQ